MAVYGIPATQPISGHSAHDAINLKDLATRLSTSSEPMDRNAAMVIELVSEQNHILPHMIFKPSIGIAQEYRKVRTYVPEAEDVDIGDGAGSVRSGIARYTEELNMLRVYNTFDLELLQLSPNEGEELRSQEEVGTVIGMSQQIASRLFYGNHATDNRQFDGLATRFSSKAQKSVYTGGGSGSALTSIYALKWSFDSGLYMFYPKHHPNMGIEVVDLGIDLMHDESGKKFRAVNTEFAFKWGMFVADQRNVRRYADIESAGATGNFNPDVMATLLNFMNDSEGVWMYCNRHMMTQLDIQQIHKANVEHEPRNPWGLPVRWFMGTPLALCDCILPTETETRA